jgi:4-amino-4-deoxy-L-arabinose transferase-like glycosyltransferase
LRKDNPLNSISDRSPEVTESGSQKREIISRTRDSQKLPYPLLAAVIVVSFLAITRFMKSFNGLAATPDSFSFLENGAYFAGFPHYQDYNPNRPPVIPFLLSLMFRITGPLIIDGYLLSIFFYSIAMIACFLIAREIMNPWLSLLASISFGIAPQVFIWSGVILSNVEGVAVASLSLAMLILAVKSDKRLFLLAFPLIALAPQTRYTMASVAVPAVVYLFATRKDIKFNKHISGGILASILLLAVFSFQWLSYPLSHNLGLSALIPPPELGGPTSALTFLLNFPGELGGGVYGYVLTVLFVSGTIFALFVGLRRGFIKKTSDISPIVYALLAWFALLFLYYSLDWPNKQVRYSVEFAMPAIIVAFWSLSIVLRPLTSLSFDRSKVMRQRLLPVAVALLMISSVTVLALASGTSAIQSTAPINSELNIGTSQVGAWLTSNAPENTIIASNVPEYSYGLFWFAAADTVHGIVDVSSARLRSGADYSSLNVTLTKDHVDYLIVYPDLGFFASPYNKTLASFVPVFTSEAGNITIFRVFESR